MVVRCRTGTPVVSSVSNRGPASAVHRCALHRVRDTRTISEIHLQDVEPAGEAIDRVDDLALVHEHVVELDRGIFRQRRPRRNEGRDLLRLVGVGDVVGAQAAVEERADYDLVGLPRCRPRRVLVDAAPGSSVGDWRGLWQPAICCSVAVQGSGAPDGQAHFACARIGAAEWHPDR